VPKSARISEIIMENNSLAGAIQKLGYDLRFSLHQRPDWVYFSAAARQFVLREELLDEFRTQAIEEAYRRSVVSISRYIERQKGSGKPRILVTLDPTKIFANGLAVDYSETVRDHRRLFQLSPRDVNRGEHNQVFVERELQASNVPVVSLFDVISTIKNRHDRERVYLGTDSHWSRRTVADIAPLFLESLAQKGLIAQQCIKNPDGTPGAPGTMMGDLGGPFFLKGKSYFFQDLIHESDLDYKYVSAAEQKPSGCPVIHWVGTSYGEVHLPCCKNDIGTAMQSHYAGIVKNNSIASVGPAIPITRFLQNKEYSADDLVIWEIPFRSLKVDEWHPQLD
jgi:hypothetical protein